MESETGREGGRKRKSQERERDMERASEREGIGSVGREREG